MLRRTRIAFVIGMTAVAVSAVAEVRAQSLFELLFRPRWQQEQKEPEKPKERVELPDGTVYNSANEADADTKRAAKPNEYVVVIGDTLAEQLSQGLAEAFLTERTDVAIIKKVRASSGLVRIDYHNWIAEAANIVANERATAFVVMLGSNDRQALRDETGSHEIRSDRWRDIYAKRVDDLLAKLKEKGTPVFVVGMPSMRVPRLSEDMVYINEILRERTIKANLRYVDVWDGFVDEKNQFIATGPALDGQTRRLRLGDGVHMTRFGSRKIAHYAERDLVRLFDQRVRGPFVPFGPEAGPVLPGVKPIAGPVLPLNMPAGPVGGLAGARPVNASDPPSLDPKAARTLVDGTPADAVAGRADDFSWPNRTPLIVTPTPAVPGPATVSAPPATQPR